MKSIKIAVLTAVIGLATACSGFAGVIDDLWELEQAKNRALFGWMMPKSRSCHSNCNSHSNCSSCNHRSSSCSHKYRPTIYKHRSTCCQPRKTCCESSCNSCESSCNSCESKCHTACEPSCGQ